VIEIVNYCGVVGLFDKDLFRQCNILTSIKIQRSFVKLSMFVPVEEYKKFLLIDAVNVPFYKKDKNARLFQRNAKEWYRLIKEVFKRDNYICQYCGKAGGKLEADHVIPFSKGGKDTIENLVTSCQKCNRQKRDKTVDEFKQWRLSHNE
jgi:5-methylcytosine-specific restriction endonuclease McrA